MFLFSGFRDIVDRLKMGFRVLIPYISKNTNLNEEMSQDELKPGKQFSTSNANASRMVTKVLFNNLLKDNFVFLIFLFFLDSFYYRKTK